jgi:hypothetical protein
VRTDCLKSKYLMRRLRPNRCERKPKRPRMSFAVFALSDNYYPQLEPKLQAASQGGHAGCAIRSELFSFVAERTLLIVPLYNYS